MITAEQAIEMLDICYSKQDPIVFQGQEMHVSELDYAVGPTDLGRPASSVHITYWKEGSVKCRGTLSGMLNDRMKG